VNPDPEGAASREARRLRRLGPNPACVICGETRNQILELHHCAGQHNHAGLTVVECKNCHGMHTSQYRDLGISMDRPSTVLDQIIAIMSGVGKVLADIGRALMECGAKLVEFRAGLDRDHPGWAAASWAQPVQWPP
jgi:hypothetical protein